MTNNESSPRFIVASVLHDLSTDAEAVLDLAKALEDQAAGTASRATPQKLRELSALVKSAALALIMAATNVVGATERLALVATLVEVDECDGELPS